MQIETNRSGKGMKGMGKLLKTAAGASMIIALLSPTVLAETNVTTRTVRKSYINGRVWAETNVTHTIARHNALKRKMRRQFQDVDATLALRDSRAGYKGGEWSKDWQKEAKAWLESQDFEKLAPAFEFVDSKGFRHLMSFAVVDDEVSKSRPSRIYMEREIAEMKAKTVLSRAWDADVERCSDESEVKTDSSVEKVKSESAASFGKHSGIFQLVEKPLKVGGEMKTVVVYGIIPAWMKFG